MTLEQAVRFYVSTYSPLQYRGSFEPSFAMQSLRKVPEVRAIFIEHGLIKETTDAGALGGRKLQSIMPFIDPTKAKNPRTAALWHETAVRWFAGKNEKENKRIERIRQFLEN